MAGLLAWLAATWLGGRSLIVLYRGQREATQRILSPLARRNPADSAALVEAMRAAGLRDAEIAGYAARWHVHPVPAVAAPPGLAGIPLGAVGITTSQIMGMAAHFAAGGVVHVIRVPAALALRPLGWPCLEMEAEHVVLNEAPVAAMAGIMPASRVPSLVVNERDLLVPGR